MDSLGSRWVFRDSLIISRIFLWFLRDILRSSGYFKDVFVHSFGFFGILRDSLGSLGVCEIPWSFLGCSMDSWGSFSGSKDPVRDCQGLLNDGWRLFTMLQIEGFSNDLKDAERGLVSSD